MTDEQIKRETMFGPIIVALANAFRSFDAPVRYPVLYRAPGLTFEPKTLSEIFALPRMSSFITLIEHFVGMFVLLPILLYRKGIKHFLDIFRRFDRRDWISVIFISAGGSALGLFFFLIALALGNPTVAILIQKMQPLITLIFAIAILGERPSKFFYAVLVLALTGVGLITVPDIIGKEFGFSAVALIAALCSLAAATFWGGSTVFGRILTKKVDFWDLTLLRYIGGFIFLLILNVFLFTYNGTYFSLLGTKVHVFGYDHGGGVFKPLDWQWYIGLSIIYFALLTGGVIPLGIYYFGLKRSKAAIAGIAELAFPLLAIFVNYYFLGFGLTLIQIIGAIILLGSVSILSYINTLEYYRNSQLEEFKN